MELETLFAILAILCAVLAIADRVRSIEWLAAGLALAAVAVIVLGGDVHANT